MRRVFRVFVSDWKRLSSNVVAIVIIMGLSIIPALYAWFNILSNWDPYGESATSQMNIAVFSEDEGVTVGDLSLNVGDTVVNTLKGNSTIGWVFTDTKEETLVQVKSGECYAAIVIPTDFSRKIISFIGGEPEHPSLFYYENSKKNAIATKITSKAKNTVQQQVNASFVSTLAEVFSKSGEMIASGGKEYDLTGTLMEKINEMNKNLDTYVNVLDTLSLVTDSAADLVDSTQQLIPNVNGLAGTNKDAVANMQKSMVTGAQTANMVAATVDVSLEAVLAGMEDISQELQQVGEEEDYTKLTKKMQTTMEITDQTMTVLGDLIGDTDAYTKTQMKYNLLKQDLQKLSDDLGQTQEKADRLTADIGKEIGSCQASLLELKSTFDHKIVPSLNQDVYDVEYALIEAQVLLGQLDTNFVDVQKALSSYSMTLGNGTESIVATRDYVADMQKGLKKLTENLAGLRENEQYQQIAEIVQADPTFIAEFISSPVQLENEKIYEIKTYGSAMAPFYTVLALWVGALILVALIHVKVHPGKELKDVMPRHIFFGRYLTFFLIGQMQTLITICGDLFYIRIQCVHPVLFWLAGAVTSLVFTLFIYSLTVAFGNVGQALAVVVMVVQVAGAGGTFPVEVLPQVYQSVYRFLPFTYGMNAMRECVGGMYQNDYAKDLGVLMIYAVISLIIGLILSKPFRPLNERIEVSKKKSGLML